MLSLPDWDLSHTYLAAGRLTHCRKVGWYYRAGGVFLSPYLLDLKFRSRKMAEIRQIHVNCNVA